MNRSKSLLTLPAIPVMSFFGRLLVSVAFFVFAENLAATSEQKEKVRDTWYIGFGFGGGLDARYYENGQMVDFNQWLRGSDYPNDTYMPYMNFKIGKTLNSKTLIGFDWNFNDQVGTWLGKDYFLSISNYLLMYTRFPNEVGYFWRVGAGAAVLSIDNVQTFATRRVDGAGILAGIGYAIWLGKSFNMTINLDHSRQFYKLSEPDPFVSKYTAVFVGFDWY